MADKFFHEFPTTTTLKDTSILLLDQDNQTTAVTLAQLKSFLVQSNQGDAFPTGGIMMFSSSTIPTGWLECDGRVLDINIYVNLHKIIGQTYKTLNTFNVLSSFQIPDLRGEFVRGWDHNKGVDTGRVLGTPQGDMFKAHDHPFYWGQNSGTRAIGGSTPGNSVQNYSYYGIGGDQIGNTGGTETRPRNVALVYCIKT